jgi:hypothetical protein
LAILSSDTTRVINGREVRVVQYGAGVGTKSPDDRYDLCVTGPQKPTSCTTYPFYPPEQNGFRLSVVGCVPDQGAGDYLISWRVRGVVLGDPLTYHAPARAAASSPCSSFLGKPIVGGSSASFNADFKDVNRYSLPTAGVVNQLAIYLAPTGTSGQQVIKGVVYADSNGAPGALLGTTNELTFQGSPADWYYLTFPAPMLLSVGDYWIGVITGAQSQVAGFRYDNVSGSLIYNANPYTAGPSNPFGPIITHSEQISLYAVYNVSKP